jgi:hypothetical protein
VARPDADAIVTALLRQTARLEPRPVFFANLGDFAGPGTIEHAHYPRLVELRLRRGRIPALCHLTPAVAGKPSTVEREMAEPLPLPDVCVVGNHDLDDPAARDA